ncbi:MAG: TetR family transcriptional regulator [Pseudonocardiales bacterium]|nr:MAG: TetR family transcriptional regulator [Pseudonocardiales bacterium]
MTRRVPRRVPRPGPRRAPEPEERHRDAVASRARILAAAVAEFGAKGYAGARVSQIAARAGVNQQLISYYFGGKAGLYRELLHQGQRRPGPGEVESDGIEKTGRGGSELPVDVVVGNYVMQTLYHRDWSRLLVWQALTEGDTPAIISDPERAYPEDLAVIRRRQQAGELPADVDPACLLLFFFAAATASVTLPQVVRGLFNTDPAGQEFHHHYAEQLGRLVRHLRQER